LTTTVDNIEHHIESTTVSGQAIRQDLPATRCESGHRECQVTAISKPPFGNCRRGLTSLIINYSASSVPILQLGLSGNGLTEQQLNDLGQNFLRPQLVTVLGRNPFPLWRKQRQSMIDLNPGLVQSKGLAHKTFSPQSSSKI